MYRLIIKNLPPGTTIADIDNFFNKFSEIIHIDLKIHQKPLIAFVQFANERAALEAAKSTNGYNFKGFTITVAIEDNEVGDQPATAPAPAKFDKHPPKLMPSQKVDKSKSTKNKWSQNAFGKSETNAVSLGVNKQLHYQGKMENSHAPSRWDRDMNGKKNAKSETKAALHYKPKSSRWGGYVFENVSVVGKDDPKDIGNPTGPPSKTTAPLAQGVVVVPPVKLHDKPMPVAVQNAISQLRQKLACREEISNLNQWETQKTNTNQGETNFIESKLSALRQQLETLQTINQSSTNPCNVLQDFKKDFGKNVLDSTFQDTKGNDSIEQQKIALQEKLLALLDEQEAFERPGYFPEPEYVRDSRHISQQNTISTFLNSKNEDFIENQTKDLQQKLFSLLNEESNENRDDARHEMSQNSKYFQNFSSNSFDGVSVYKNTKNNEDFDDNQAIKLQEKLFSMLNDETNSNPTFEGNILENLTNLFQSELSNSHDEDVSEQKINLQQKLLNYLTEEISENSPNVAQSPTNSQDSRQFDFSKHFEENFQQNNLNIAKSKSKPIYNRDFGNIHEDYSKNKKMRQLKTSIEPERSQDDRFHIAERLEAIRTATKDQSTNNPKSRFTTKTAELKTLSQHYSASKYPSLTRNADRFTISSSEMYSKESEFSNQHYSDSENPSHSRNSDRFKISSERFKRNYQNDLNTFETYSKESEEPTHYSDSENPSLSRNASTSERLQRNFQNDLNTFEMYSKESEEPTQYYSDSENPSFARNEDRLNISSDPLQRNFQNDLNTFEMYSKESEFSNQHYSDSENPSLARNADRFKNSSEHFKRNFQHDLNTFEIYSKESEVSNQNYSDSENPSLSRTADRFKNSSERLQRNFQNDLNNFESKKSNHPSHSRNADKFNISERMQKKFQQNDIKTIEVDSSDEDVNFMENQQTSNRNSKEPMFLDTKRVTESVLTDDGKIELNHSNNLTLLRQKLLSMQTKASATHMASTSKASTTDFGNTMKKSTTQHSEYSLQNNLVQRSQRQNFNGADSNSLYHDSDDRTETCFQKRRDLPGKPRNDFNNSSNELLQVRKKLVSSSLQTKVSSQNVTNSQDHTSSSSWDKRHSNDVSYFDQDNRLLNSITNNQHRNQTITRGYHISDETMLEQDMYANNQDERFLGHEQSKSYINDLKRKRSNNVDETSKNYETLDHISNFRESGFMEIDNNKLDLKRKRMFDKNEEISNFSYSSLNIKASEASMQKIPSHYSGSLKWDNEVLPQSDQRYHRSDGYHSEDHHPPVSKILKNPQEKTISSLFVNSMNQEFNPDLTLCRGSKGRRRSGKALKLKRLRVELNEELARSTDPAKRWQCEKQLRILQSLKKLP